MKKDIQISQIILISVIGVLLGIDIIGIVINNDMSFLRILSLFISIIGCYYLYKGSEIWRIILIIKIILSVVLTPLLYYLMIDNYLNVRSILLTERNNTLYEIFDKDLENAIIVIIITFIYIIDLMLLLFSKNIKYFMDVQNKKNTKNVV